MQMRIYFEGKKKVLADYMGETIVTDQPLQAGGEGTAPAPFTLFLASIGTCAGIYVRSFCEQRGIPTHNIYLTQKMSFNPLSRMIDKIDIEIHLPPDFPDKYKDAVINAADLCAVKKHLINAPDMRVYTV